MLTIEDLAPRPRRACSCAPLIHCPGCLATGVLSTMGDAYIIAPGEGRHLDLDNFEAVSYL
jgi:hypothetical protein